MTAEVLVKIVATGEVVRMVPGDSLDVGVAALVYLEDEESRLWRLVTAKRARRLRESIAFARKAPK